ncbi:MAG: hypothetical protein CR980_00235 [Propionibacteriales bacterium]|nr:MAG: hypothetical protein CR980_00235 [Propionibacteriales bacterium]
MIRQNRYWIFLGKELEMGPWVKKIAVVMIVAFALFYLFTRPEDAANAVKTFFGAFTAIGQFFVALAE